MPKILKATCAYAQNMMRIDINKPIWIYFIAAICLSVITLFGSAATHPAYAKEAIVPAATTMPALSSADVTNTFIALGEEGAPAGTPQDPFLISTEADLVAFATSVNGKSVVRGGWVDSATSACTYAGKTVVLTQDIELENSFTPIGIGANASSTALSPAVFSGIFNGQGHTISGLRFTKASNPQLANSFSHGALWFSGLFGSIKDASILNVMVHLSDEATFTVVATAGEASAGLIAQVAGGINNISSCGVTGEIAGGSKNVAGVVGRVESGSTLDIDHCYHQGSIITANSGGGIVGAVASSTVTMTSCYQYGEVSSTSTSTYATKFYGQLGASGSKVVATNCVASSDAALFGTNMTATTQGCLSGVSDWNALAVKEVLGTTNFTYGSDPATPPELGELAKASYFVTFEKGSDVAGAVPVSFKQQAGSTFEFPNANLTRRGYTFVGWSVKGEGETETTATIYAPSESFTMPEGEVVFEAQWQAMEPVLISSEEELRIFAADINAGILATDNNVYQLTKDITLSSVWTPIGSGKYSFQGVFDGAGHVVCGLSVTDASVGEASAGSVYAGFFGKLDGAIIRNLGVEGTVNVSTATYAGGLAGLASGARASGNKPEDTCIIENCYANVTITSAGYTGGLAGQGTQATFANSYALGAITLNESGTAAGGLVGRYQSASTADPSSVAMSSCYSAVSLHTLNTKAALGGLFGLVSEAYAYVEAGSAWQRCVNTFTLETSSIPVYTTVSSRDEQTAATTQTNATYQRSFDVLCSQDTLTLLNTQDGEVTGAFKANTQAANEETQAGLPLLSWQEQEKTLPVSVGASSYAPALDLRFVTYTSTVAAGYVPTMNGQAFYVLDKGEASDAGTGAGANSGATTAPTSYVMLLTQQEISALTSESFSLQEISDEAGAATALLVGDANNNGRVNIVDAQVAYDMARGHYSDFSRVAQAGWLAANINADTTLDATDAFAIQYLIHTSNAKS